MEEEYGDKPYYPTEIQLLLKTILILCYGPHTLETLGFQSLPQMKSIANRSGIFKKFNLHSDQYILEDNVRVAVNSWI